MWCGVVWCGDGDGDGVVVVLVVVVWACGRGHTLAHLGQLVSDTETFGG